MGKRKGRKQSGETLISRINNCENEREEEKVGRFFACYLLTSLCPRFKGHTYIGFTVNPRRRIRQHNGEIGCGAWRTKRKRPWEMVLCIYGFPTNVAALQFEWAWQHPVESLAVRKAAASFKSLSGVANKIKLAYTMLTLPAWQSLNLTVNFFSTKYQKYMSGCLSLSKQMKTRVCSMDDLPCYNGDEECDVSMSLHESTREESLNSRETQKDDASFVSGEDFEKDCEELQINLSPVREENQGLSFNINTVEKSRSSSFDGEKDYQLGIKNPGVICHKIEIIDLFTPSPCYVIKSGSSKCKKRRRPTLYPEIIDLTNSPLFV